MKKCNDISSLLVKRDELGNEVVALKKKYDELRQQHNALNLEIANALFTGKYIRIGESQIFHIKKVNKTSISFDMRLCIDVVGESFKLNKHRFGYGVCLVPDMMNGKRTTTFSVNDDFSFIDDIKFISAEEYRNLKKDFKSRINVAVDQRGETIWSYSHVIFHLNDKMYFGIVNGFDETTGKYTVVYPINKDDIVGNGRAELFGSDFIIDHNKPF